jgi:hypothetical protein
MPSAEASVPLMQLKNALYGYRPVLCARNFMTLRRLPFGQRPDDLTLGTVSENKGVWCIRVWSKYARAL